VNSQLSASVGVEVLPWEALSPQAGRLTSQWTVTESIEPLDSTKVFVRGLEELLGVCAPEDCFVRFRAEATTNEGNFHDSLAYFFPVPIKNARIPASSVALSSITLIDPDHRDGKASRATITLTSNNTAAFVTVETSSTLVPGHFSDNALILLPGEPQSISFIAAQNLRFSEKELESSLSVRSL